MDRFTAQGYDAAAPLQQSFWISRSTVVAGAGLLKNGEPLVAAVSSLGPLTFKLVGPITTARVVPKQAA